MGVPTLEKAPGISEPWLGIWRATLKQLQEQGTWDVAQRPLLDQYVYALKAWDEHRQLAEATPFSHSHATDRDFVHPGFTSADRERKASMSLADQLGLTARARKSLDLKVGMDAEDDDPLASLDDELAPRRAAAS